MISLYTAHEKKRYKGLMLNISYIEKEIDKIISGENAAQGRTRL
jgi:hypothetical protein